MVSSPGRRSGALSKGPRKVGAGPAIDQAAMDGGAMDGAAMDGAGCAGVTCVPQPAQ